MRISNGKLTRAIVLAGVTTSDVAKAADLSDRRVQQLQARGGKVNMNIIKAIARRLGVKPEELAE